MGGGSRDSLTRDRRWPLYLDALPVSGASFSDAEAALAIREYGGG
jgi:hypothetical protein